MSNITKENTKESEPIIRVRKPSIIQDGQNVAVSRKPSVAQDSRKTSVVQDSLPSMHGPSMRRQSRRESRLEPRGMFPMYGGRRASMLSKTSISGTSDMKLHAIHVKYQNTYRLGPEPEDIFSPSVVEKAARKILDRFLIGETYETEKCKLMAKNISDEVRARCKELVCPRYKIVCYVAIGQDCNQSMQLTSRSLWNVDTDNSCTITYASNDLFAVVTVFAVYFD